MSLPRKITIEPVLNGYLVRVGCQTLVYNFSKDLLSDLDRYFRDPKALEDEYRQYSKHRDLLRDIPCDPKSIAASIRQDHANQCETGQISTEPRNPVLREPCCDQEAHVPEPPQTEPAPPPTVRDF